MLLTCGECEGTYPESDIVYRSRDYVICAECAEIMRKTIGDAFPGVERRAETLKQTAQSVHLTEQIIQALAPILHDQPQAVAIEALGAAMFAALLNTSSTQRSRMIMLYSFANRLTDYAARIAAGDDVILEMQRRGKRQ